MINKRNIELLKNQGYRFVGDNTLVKICNWNKQSLRGGGECYKYKFYGIPSWKCVQMSPGIACDNSCIHCWRPTEINMNKIINLKKLQNPNEIIELSIQAQKKLLTGFGGHARVNKLRYQEAQEPSHFAISLIGEPTLYPKIGEFVNLLRKQGKTSFIVTNGLHPEIIAKLEKKKQLPTQLYVSLNSSNEKDYIEWHKSNFKDAWKRFNKTLDILNRLTKKGKRTVLRMTLVRNMNMDDKHIEEFAEIIKKSGVMFVEVKSFMSLGYARNRLGYETMPSLKEIEVFARKLARKSGYIVLDKHIPSRIVLLGKNKTAKKRMKIKNKEI